MMSYRLLLDSGRIRKGTRTKYLQNLPEQAAPALRLDLATSGLKALHLLRIPNLGWRLLMPNNDKIDDPGSDISNYIVKSGDVIVVPAIRKSIYVFGQVAKPGYLPLVQGKDFRYYISEAGGMGELALEDEIMVIKGGSRYWISPYEQTVILEEGDYVYVPKVRLRSFRTYAAEYAIYIGMLASIATVILLVITAFK